DQAARPRARQPLRPERSVRRAKSLNQPISSVLSDRAPRTDLGSRAIFAGRRRVGSEAPSPRIARAHARKIRHAREIHFGWWALRDGRMISYVMSSPVLAAGPHDGPSADAATPTRSDALSEVARSAAAGDRAAVRELLTILGPVLLRSVRALMGARHPDV